MIRFKFTLNTWLKSNFYRCNKYIVGYDWATTGVIGTTHNRLSFNSLENSFIEIDI